MIWELLLQTSDFAVLLGTSPEAKQQGSERTMRMKFSCAQQACILLCSEICVLFWESLDLFASSSTPFLCLFETSEEVPGDPKNIPNTLNLRVFTSCPREWWRGTWTGDPLHVKTERERAWGSSGTEWGNQGHLPGRQPFAPTILCVCTSTRVCVCVHAGPKGSWRVKTSR